MSRKFFEFNISKTECLILLYPIRSLLFCFHSTKASNVQMWNHLQQLCFSLSVILYTQSIFSCSSSFLLHIHVYISILTVTAQYFNTYTCSISHPYRIPGLPNSSFCLEACVPLISVHHNGNEMLLLQWKADQDTFLSKNIFNWPPFAPSSPNF